MIPEPARRPAPPRGPRYPRALAVCVVSLLALSVAGDSVTMNLRYERAALANGEWWRLITAHLVHLDVRHLALNLAGLVALWWLYAADARPRDWLIVALVSALAIGAGLYLLSPSLHWYVGLSGVLHGFWAAAAVAAWHRWRAESVVTLAVLAAKLAAEQIFGPLSAGVSSGLPVVTVAHLYGALGGLAAALGLRLWRQPV
jgi:rhomboid family GlyGly-CTERM serine protease